MSALDDILKNAQRARLIPTVADSRKEERIELTDHRRLTRQPTMRRA